MSQRQSCGLKDNGHISVADELESRIQSKLKRELGPIYDYLYMPNIVEIMLNCDGNIWIERLGQPMEKVSQMCSNQAESMIATVAATFKAVLTRENPILECELPIKDARFEALIPPVVKQPVFSIRLKTAQTIKLDDYVATGAINTKQLEYIKKAIKERKNILVVGGTGSGKTTLTNALIAEIAIQTPEHRLIIIEDTHELQSKAKNTVLLHTTHKTDMQKLLRATLRLRPDRILVGEVRGAESLSLLKAWNTGHPGGVTTLHANNAPAGLTRLEQLVGEATQTDSKKLIAEAIDLIIYISKSKDNKKRLIKQIMEVTGYKNQQYLLSEEIL